jgi:signal transduction histidine kinase
MLDFQSILLTVIRKKIFLIELLVLFLGALGSYFLAKRTLLPIQSKSEQQKRFLADVNHELKNPLAALKTTLEVSLQQKDWTSGELKALFGDLKGEVERLSGMTQDLLYLERANAPMSPQELDVGNIIEEVIHSLSPLAKEKNIFFTRDIPSLTVWGRSEDLKKVFYNLIHNAIKFSYPNGEISLSCPKKRSVVIKDFGSGIDKKDIPHIFERFYKADDSRTFSNENGSGLGLSIVKKICDENSWGISVKSEKGSGTAFSVWF